MGVVFYRVASGKGKEQYKNAQRKFGRSNRPIGLGWLSQSFHRSALQSRPPRRLRGDASGSRTVDWASTRFLTTKGCCMCPCDESAGALRLLLACPEQAAPQQTVWDMRAHRPPALDDPRRALPSAAGLASVGFQQLVGAPRHVRVRCTLGFPWRPRRTFVMSFLSSAAPSRRVARWARSRRLASDGGFARARALASRTTFPRVSPAALGRGGAAASPG
jgi:hypothetical protein